MRQWQLVNGVSDRSLTHVVSLCTGVSSLPPPEDSKMHMLISELVALYVLLFSISIICLPFWHIFLLFQPQPPFFIFFPSLPPYLSISIILHPVISPPPPRLLPVLLLLMPFPSFPSSSLKPVKGYWAPLTIQSNSIRSLPYKIFFFFLLSK